jgi:hypothetical protein
MAALRGDCKLSVRRGSSPGDAQWPPLDGLELSFWQFTLNKTFANGDVEGVWVDLLFFWMVTYVK